ncbi:NADP oxidoreductase [Streptomyces tateyamensis]|uniref:NADP oxidoreductase n=1 Tax=Streptomyces tateyamensis TaxID=565073 RepID=A0A2V4P6C0_9ACTN|nr:NAD(P)-binding domain-containing protein [Streptomyces tateyamensis]PYC78566.1 NADP oxidoreductase [Streptomyces tateyamensis]
MKIAVLGTGEVGRRIAGKLVELGHQVTLGSRTAQNPAAAEWAAGSGGAHGTFAQAAADAELVVNATGGLVSLAALTAAGEEHLSGKVVIDVANPLDFSGGFPPKVVQTEGLSLAEQIQRAFPQARVVKTLNTMNNAVMVEPGLVPGHHTVFLSGDDEQAKTVVAGLLQEIGWRPDQITDLGALHTARATEQLLPLWLHVYGTQGEVPFNFAIASA